MVNQGREGGKGGEYLTQQEGFASLQCTSKERRDNFTTHVSSLSPAAVHSPMSLQQQKQPQ